MSRFFVYEDWTTEETPRCFYVGKGSADRVEKLARNQHHCEIATALGQCRVVVHETDDEQEALDLERKLILERHVHPRDPAYNGIGCNRTTGGQGSTGRIVSQETRRRISASKIGKSPNRIWTKENREAVGRRMSELHRGHSLSEAHKQALSMTMNEPDRKAAMRAAVSSTMREKYANDDSFARRVRETRCRGTAHVNASFSETDIRAMRQEWLLIDRSVRGTVTRFYRKWAAQGATTPQAVAAIVKGRTWKHVL